MADYLQLALEETPRYEGAVTTTPYRISTDVVYFPLTSAVINPGPQHDDRGDELRGIEGAVPLLIEGYEPAGSIEERCYLNNLTWLLELAGLTGTVTVGDGIITDPDAAVIPATVQRWEFAKRGGVEPQTAQIIAAYGAHGVFLRGQGFGVSQLTLTGPGRLTAELMGLVLANIADPSLTPSYDSQTIRAIRRGDLTLEWLASTGLTNIDDFSIQIANPLERVNTGTLATPSFFPDVLEHGDDRVRLTGTIPKRRLADADVDALLSGATFAATARWLTPTSILATSKKYTIWVEMPACQLMEGEFDTLGNKRRFGGSYGFWAAWDEAAGHDFKVTVLNSVSAIDTYA